MLELAALLSDGNWHSTSYLGVAAGKYLRPEIAWRTGRGNINQGQRLYTNWKLKLWRQMGRVESRRNGKFVEWRLINSQWVVLYLRALIDILREQAENRSRPLIGKNRMLERIEREREILRLHKEGFSQRQIAERVGCHHVSVHRVLKAAKGRLELEGGAIAPRQ